MKHLLRKMKEQIMKNLRILFIPIILVTLLLACATTGPGGKRSFILISSGQEVAIGQGMADELAKTEKTLDDPEWQAYLNDVGQKIVKVSDRTDIEYQFVVIESDQVNAFAAPGGFVYFYTGLLREMNSEAEMAAVMAHEISHVVGRHGIKRLQTAMGVTMAAQLVLGDDANGLVKMAVGIGMTLLFSDYSRNAEREADNFGIHYMVQAGYDPNGAVEMFETLGRLGGEGKSNVFEKLVSSHPETQERIANAHAQIEAAKPLPPNLHDGRDRYQKMLKRLPK